MKIHEVSSKSYPSMVAHPQILEYSIIMHQIIHSFESDLQEYLHLHYHSAYGHKTR